MEVERSCKPSHMLNVNPLPPSSRTQHTHPKDLSGVERFFKKHTVFKIPLHLSQILKKKNEQIKITKYSSFHSKALLKNKQSCWVTEKYILKNIYIIMPLNGIRTVYTPP